MGDLPKYDFRLLLLTGVSYEGKVNAAERRISQFLDKQVFLAPTPIYPSSVRKSFGF